MQKSLRVILGLSLCGLLLSACATSVNLERYSLVGDCQAAAFKHPGNISLRLSPQLNDGGIVMRTGEHTLVSAQSHRWALPLNEQLTTLFHQVLLDYKAEHPQLAATVDKMHYEILVTAFQGNNDGQAEVSALFTLKDASGQARLKVESDAKRALRADGYSALCTALEVGFIDISRKFVATTTQYLQSLSTPTNLQRKLPLHCLWGDRRRLRH